MSRFNLVQPQQAEGQTQELLDAVGKQLGRVPNLMKALANSPAALQSYLAFHGALGKGQLDLRTRERIALAIGEANACQYCVSAHTALGNRAGLDESEIAAAREGWSADPRGDAAVKFALALMEHRGEATAAEFNALREAGFDDGQIVEIVVHVALNVLTNFIARSGQIDIDFPKVRLLGQQEPVAA
jgi:uncharacterized peroxidase-related enzyme